VQAFLEETNTRPFNDNMIVESESLFEHRCSFCNEVMEISEGDVIYNSKWYHKACWIIVEKEPQESTDDSSAAFSIADYA